MVWDEIIVWGAKKGSIQFGLINWFIEKGFIRFRFSSYLRIPEEIRKEREDKLENPMKIDKNSEENWNIKAIIKYLLDLSALQSNLFRHGWILLTPSS